MENLSVESINVNTLKEEIKQEVSRRHQLGSFELSKSPHWVSVKSSVLIHTIEASLESNEVLSRKFSRFFDRIEKRMPKRVSAVFKKVASKLNKTLFSHGNGYSNHSITHLTKLSLENQKLLLALINEINTSNFNRVLELESRIKALEAIPQQTENDTSDA